MCVCNQRAYADNLADALNFKSERKWPSKKLGIFEFLEFLKVVVYSTIGPHNIYIFLKVPWGYFLMAKYSS